MRMSSKSPCHLALKHPYKPPKYEQPMVYPQIERVKLSERDMEACSGIVQKPKPERPEPVPAVEYWTIVEEPYLG